MVTRNCCRCGKDFRIHPAFADPRGGPRRCPDCSDCMRHGPQSRYQRPLTLRDQQIIEFVRQGRINKEIAYQLHLSESTVKVYMHLICRKLGVPNRTAIAVHATEQILKQAGVPATDIAFPGTAVRPDGPPRTVRRPLSARQLQLAALVVQGKKNEEIAQTLQLAKSSVKEYLSRLYRKVNAGSRTQLAVRAAMERWGSQPETAAGREGPG